MHRLGLWVELDWALYHPRSTETFPFLRPSPTCLSRVAVKQQTLKSDLKSGRTTR